MKVEPFIHCYYSAKEGGSMTWIDHTRVVLSWSSPFVFSELYIEKYSLPITGYKSNTSFTSQLHQFIQFPQRIRPACLLSSAHKRCTLSRESSNVRPNDTFSLKVSMFVYCQSFCIIEPDSNPSRIENCQELQENILI